MEQNKKVSIIMPAYNCENYIRQAVDSVKRQTYPDWELLILNDASSDGTGEAAAKLAMEDQRIRYLENEANLGVAGTRMRGVQMAEGSWIAFLDSDDCWTEDKLEKQMQLIQRVTDAAIAFTGSAFMNEQGEKSSYILHVPERVSYKELLKQNIISCSSVLVKKELVLKYGMPDGDLHEDFALWLQILRDGGAACGIDEPLLIYRVSSGSKSGNKLHAAHMQWKVYRFIGLGVLQASYYMAAYTVRNVKKYRGIRNHFC